MIEIKLFGTTVVDDGTSQVAGTALGGVKPRQLLEMLATDLGNPLSKDLLAERLWEGNACGRAAPAGGKAIPGHRARRRGIPIRWTRLSIPINSDNAYLIMMMRSAHALASG